MKEDRVKLSTLSKDTIIIVDENNNIQTVEEILEDLEAYRWVDIYTVVERKASFDAESILDSAIEDEQCNDMYEDWSDNIRYDIKDEDIKDLQVIFDRILSRNPSQNISYVGDKLIEIDL